MQITETIIRALSSLPLEQVQANFDRCLQAFIANPDKIISATDGAGQSYSKSLSGTAQEMVELWQEVLDYKNGIDSPGDTQIFNNLIIQVPNR